MGIKMNPPEFSDNRRHDPKRRAEAEVFDALKNLEHNGHGLYEFRYRREGKQVDYVLWLHNIARFAIQVKGGRYEMDYTGQWYLCLPDGTREPVQSPLDETADGCMEMRDGIQEAIRFKTFVIGVLILPDMQRDEQMEDVAREHNHVYIIWGLDTLLEDLQRIAADVGITRPPEPRHSRNEWSQINQLQYRGRAGLRRDDSETQEATPDRQPGQMAERQLTLGSATIHIQHVETLVIQQGPQEQDTDGRTVIPGS